MGRKRIINENSVTSEQKLADLLVYTEKSGDCLLWSGAKNSDGYGAMSGNVKVHRLAAELYYQEDITGRVVMHTCDTPLCINPVHLKLGSPRENALDRYQKGRYSRVFTVEQVKKTRALLGTNLFTHKEISEIVGCDPRRISDVNRNLYDENGKFCRK